MKKWELFTRDNMNYLKLENYIFCLFIVNFVSFELSHHSIVTVLASNFHFFSLFNILDCAVMIVGILCITSWNVCYLIVVDVCIAIVLFSNILFVVLIRRGHLFTYVRIACEICLIGFLTRWVWCFSKFSHGGMASGAFVSVDLLFYQAMTYSISRKKNDIVFLIQHVCVQ